MAMSTYGSSLDLHAGGADLQFPHHAYEAAQAEAFSGVRPFARAWMHVGIVRVGAEKMAKSTGNLVLVSDVLTSHSAAALRMLLLRRHFAESWSFVASDLDVVEGEVEQLFGASARPAKGSGDGVVAQEVVLSALRDDLDVVSALQIALEEGGPAARTLVEILGLR